jgi:hypothetical protein
MSGPDSVNWARRSTTIKWHGHPISPAAGSRRPRLYGAVLKTTLVAVALVVAYCLIQVYVGHGEARAALVLVAGRVSPYLQIAALGWLGICGLAIAAWRVRRGAGSNFLAASAGLLLLSWVGLLWVTTNKERTLWTSIPFLLVAAWVLYRRGRVSS